MFEGRKLGAYIQFLRKSRGQTQSRLAETLGVSPQAVSNWERGESMPDIALLADLARALGTSADRMLAAAEDFSAEAYEKMARVREPEEVLPDPVPEKEPFAREEPAESCPEAPPQVGPPGERVAAAPGESAAREIRQALRDAFSGLRGLAAGGLSIRDAIREAADEAFAEAAAGREEVCPEEERERREALLEARRFTRDAERALFELRLPRREGKRVIVSSLAGDSAEGGSEGGDEWARVLSLAPFASQETMDALVLEMGIGIDLPRIVALAPFVSASVLAELARRSLEEGESGGGKAVVALAPFMESADLESLLLRQAGGVCGWRLAAVAPFIGSGTLTTLLLRWMEKEGKGPAWRDVVALAPFLESADLEWILSRRSETGDPTRLADIAPFLGREAVDRLIRDALGKKEEKRAQESGRTRED